jgi:hypothetical protein
MKRLIRKQSPIRWLSKHVRKKLTLVSKLSKPKASHRSSAMRPDAVYIVPIWSSPDEIGRMDESQALRSYWIAIAPSLGRLTFVAGNGTIWTVCAT